MSTIYPLSYLPINPIQTVPVTFNYDYISHLESLGVTDYFLPSQFAQNPLFAQVDEFHQNIGILQTANNALDTILTYVDMLKNINNPTQDVLKEIADEINSVINNTTFDNLNVFSQTINIGDDKLNLSIPAFTPDTDIEKYEELLLKQKDNIFSALQNLSITTPLSTQNVNPVDFETFTSLLSSGTLLNAYNTELINPQTLELLL
ncbi:hypothetical protein [Caminibacter pacificus]|jgi:hypothetical protein